MSIIDTSKLSNAIPETYPNQKYVPGPDIPFPDTSKLIVDDGAPVDNVFTEKQQRLLVTSLLISWEPRDDKPFRVLNNVGLFHAYKESPFVPDAMEAINVPPTDGLTKSDNRSYFVWVVGKLPDIVIEIASDNRGGEETTKFEHYASIGVPYYVIFDPFAAYSDQPLRTFVNNGSRYQPTKPSPLGNTGLGLVLWEGIIEDEHGTWLRWCDDNGSLLLTAEEQVEQAKIASAKARRDLAKEKKRAEESERAAAVEKKRAEELEAKIKKLEAQLKKSS
ncbi:MAG: Uma2 family endonuclease [Gemmataceae bacterium]